MNRAEWFDKYAWVWDAMKEETKVIGLDGNGTKIKGIIVNIDIGSFTPFCVKRVSNSDWCESVELIKTKTIVKPASEILKWVNKNYWFFVSNGFIGTIDNCQYIFYFDMFDYCGKEPTHKYIWIPDWLMEVEE